MMGKRERGMRCWNLCLGEPIGWIDFEGFFR